MSSDASSAFKLLDVGIVGGGIGGLAAAVALRRQEHRVSVFERRDFDVEVGASISCAANGTQWLHEWDVDVPSGRPVVLLKLIMRDWEKGQVLNQYDLSGYEAEWGNVYNMFHRQDMHRMLLDAATSPEGQGPPCQVVVDHICDTVDAGAGKLTFKNGKTLQFDLVIGADGIRSVVRESIGVVPDKTSAPQTCYRCNVPKADVEALGLAWANDPAIQFWGGYPRDDLSQYYKIVMSPCAGGDVLSFYCFMPTELTNHHEEGFSWGEVSPDDIIKAGEYVNLDPRVITLLANSVERKPWRLYKHEPYQCSFKERTCILGDAAHPMMPHQSQGACQAIEDAAALGIIFSRQYAQFTNDVPAGLQLYHQVRYPRFTRVQDASRRALENLNERIGFSSLSAPEERLKAAEGKLTVAEMNRYDMKQDIADKVRDSPAPLPRAAAPGPHPAMPPRIASC